MAPSKRTKSSSSTGVRVVRATGARVSKPAPISARRAAAARRGAAKATRARSGEDVLLQAFAAQELEPTHQFTITPTKTAAGARRGATASRRRSSVNVQVDVAPSESAVILVEQNGEYSWHYPTSPRSARRGARKSAAPTTVTIPIQLTTAPRPAATGRRGARIGGGVLKVAKAVVLKFIARTGAGLAMKYLERNVRKGLIVMDGDDPATWKRVSHINDLKLGDKPLEILLFVHGTFSSTAGSFGALTATTDGRTLLQQARKRYDAVIGFDHATLAETPYENAVDLVERLGRFRQKMQIDAVTFSRGGLVFRTMVEQILPTSDTRPDVGQAVFVAVPNNGTLLAEPENWKTLVDMYTNVSMGAFNLLKLLPSAAPAAHILSEIVSGLGAFVKYLAAVIVEDAVVPGLAAQQPGGEFVRKLNEGGTGQPLPDDCRYLAVTSNFDAKAAAARAKPIGLAASFLGKLADGLVDQIMRESNDLVVNTGSMKQIDPTVGDYIDAALDFGDSATIYHTVYFAQPGVAQQLRGWLMDDDARAGFIERRGLLTVRPSAKSPFTRVRFRESEGRRPNRVGPRLARRAGRKTTDKKMKPRTTKRVNAKTASAAATKHLTKLFGERKDPHAGLGRKAKRAAAALGVGDAVPRARAYAPRLEAQSVQSSPMDNDEEIKVVGFQQLHRKIPIFGCRTTVELDKNNNMLAARSKLARVEGVSPDPDLSAKDALKKLLPKLTSLSPEQAKELTKRFGKKEAPRTFFHDQEKNKWHLAYIFGDIPARPKAVKKKGATSPKKMKAVHRHGSVSSPRERFPRMDYLVDAHDGSIVFYYSVSPTATGWVKGRGKDEDGKWRDIFVREVGSGFELCDPVRKIKTFDFGHQDMDAGARPKSPIRVKDPAANFAAAATSGVTAHLNASTVFDFYNKVLVRDGVENKKSVYLENYVNCLSVNDDDPPEWGNAVWWDNRMWYGQIKRKGRLRSVATSLDIIGHELTHGVIEHTCDLVYKNQPGALNESFADIFGVIINNWAKGPTHFGNPDKWDWEIGAGFGDDGKPWRNMKRPSVTGDPSHTNQMGNYKKADLDADDGGVHTFSNIHNKAAYNLLTMRRNKRLVFKPDEVAVVYYFTLQRLDRMASFKDVFETVIDVVKNVYREPKEQAAKVEAVIEAYKAVGIPK